MFDYLYTESCSTCQYKNTCMCDSCTNRKHFKGNENNHSDFVYESSLLREADITINITKPFKYIKNKLF